MEEITIQELLGLFDLVSKIASRYEGKDLEAIGMLGLKDGIKSYLKKERWKDNMKLSTYVSWWIKTAIEQRLAGKF